MKANVFSQVIYDLRHQPVVSTVTIVGTALSIFLIMIVTMTDLVKTVPFAPESNRGRLLYGKFINLKAENGSDSSAGMTYSVARRFFENLDKTETTTYYKDADGIDICAVGTPSKIHILRTTDDRFWKVFDFKFIEGRPFSQAEFDGGMKVAVISEMVARETFGSPTNAMGSEILIGQKPFRVIGVFEDVSPLASQSFGEVFHPFSVDDGDAANWNSEYFGPFQCAILAESSDYFDDIREEVKSRKSIFNSEIKSEGLSLADHGSPYTQEQIDYVRGSNTDPDESNKILQLLIYAIVLIVPAINLSSMTQSRLRRRIAEIGVRRAFGCSRKELIGNLLTESFVITLIGGLIGLVCCLIFGYYFSEMLFSDIDTSNTVKVTMEMLFNWQIFAMALLFCFILNILSCGVPAWRASRTDIVEALGSRNI